MSGAGSSAANISFALPFSSVSLGLRSSSQVPVLSLPTFFVGHAPASRAMYSLSWLIGGCQGSSGPDYREAPVANELTAEVKVTHDVGEAKWARVPFDAVLGEY